MPDVVESVEIHAPPKKCIEVIRGYEAYPEFVKSLKAVTVSNRKGASCDVTYELDLIKKISYTLRMTAKPPSRVEWSLVSGSIMKKNDGYWELEDIRKGVTKASYHLFIELNLWVPGPITRMLVGRNLPDMLAAFKARIEGKA